ncbi:hypothetical protein BPOR_1714g00020 [Botrytis porri]|uniref:Uncharacterized protein n=1 Tax=Botrytis porri TaxID=87229 RepID=A0A4Z1K501_9HELO|nr:hypothetical protein BPOR_1714g00020 [Botrytis porri]
MINSKRDFFDLLENVSCRLRVPFRSHLLTLVKLTGWIKEIQHCHQGHEPQAIPSPSHRYGLAS